LSSVIAVAQFGWSIWYWQFSVFLMEYVEEWEIGVVLAVGTIATLVGYPVSGALADSIGRKKTVILSFVPIFIGLGLLAIYPEWPAVLYEYALAAFGWSFVMVVERAMAADVVVEDKGQDSARTFSMIVAPAFFIDGVAPLLASGLLLGGVSQRMLILIGALVSFLALMMGPIILKETLSQTTMERARKGAKIPIRSFGRSYWRIAAGMSSFYFVSGMTLSYFGNLFVDEWHLDLPTYGLTWAAFSITQAVLSYTISGLADKNLRASLMAGVIGNSLMIGVCGAGNGLLLAFAVNFTWAPLMILWIGAENSLIAANVSEEAQGRAMGIYSLMLNSLGIISAPIGAFLWVSLGSLRSLYMLTSVASLPFLILLGYVLKTVRVQMPSLDTQAQPM